MATRDPYSTSGSAGGRSSTGTTSEEPGVAAQAQERVGQVAGQAQEQVSRVVDRAQEQAKSQLGGQVSRAAEGLGTVAEAVGAVGQQLREKDQAALAQYANQAADRIERFSHYLRERDVNELLGEAQRLARRQPTLFMGGAFALGLVAARFLKSSSEKTREQEEYYYPEYGAYRDRYRHATSPYGYNYPPGVGARTPGMSTTTGAGYRTPGAAPMSSQSMVSGGRVGTGGTSTSPSTPTRTGATSPASSPGVGTTGGAGTSGTTPTTPATSPATSGSVGGTMTGTGSTGTGSTPTTNPSSADVGSSTTGTPGQGTSQTPGTTSTGPNVTQRESAGRGSQSTTERPHSGEDR